MKNQSHIQSIFLSKGGILTIAELRSEDISHYFLQKLLKTGHVERIRQGVYKWKETEVNEWLEIQKLVPKGVICLFSAAQLHELSTFIPAEYHVAIPWKSKVRLPNYPPIKLYYWKDFQYEWGIMNWKIDANELNVFDLEKTVCDFIKSRNKVGMATTKEVLIRYLERKDRDLNKLMEYSKKLGIYTVVRQYVELLV